jgi:hypothetical protein
VTFVGGEHIALGADWKVKLLPVPGYAKAAGIFAIVSIAGFFVTIVMNAVLTTAWVLLVGYRLFRLGQK